MPSGYSLHLGLNSVDPNHYDDWSGPLGGCENDANDMAAIAHSQGYASTTVLLTQQATAGAFLDEMLALAGKLQPGDILFLSYSGHGGQVPDLDGDEGDDGLDETWCLYDRMLIDDELFRLFSRFAPAVRILMLSDSCHSGTVARNIMVRSGISFDELPGAVRSANEALVPDGANLAGFDRIRLAPPDKTLAAYMKSESMYRSLQAAASGAEQGPCAAGVILISGCQDNEVSWDGSANGLFTQTLKHVWNDGAFEGDYGSFHQSIKQYLAGRQSPNFFPVGTVTRAFRAQKPFSI
jgi:metacaspase-1